MNKTQFTAKLADKLGISKAQARKMVDAYHEVVVETLATGEPIQFVGFGTYSVVARAERVSRNPKTGQSIVIPARKRVRFKVGKKLNESVQ